MRYVLLLLSTILCGCFSSASHDLSRTEKFVLDREISWNSKPLIAPLETYTAAAGTYIATRRDSQGYFLIPPKGALKSSSKYLKPKELNGGIYLPDDASRGINVFIYDYGGSLAVNGLIMTRPPSDLMIRTNAWGPSDLVSAFKRK
jgi:hypothetical protein